MDKADLHKLLDNRKYDHAIICTFSFDPIFFEEYCLSNLNSLSSNGNITVITDQFIYQDLIERSIDEIPKQANIRYLIHPISVSGLFHPKLILLLTKNHGRLVIGSANFTLQGITSNAELITSFDFELGKNENFKEYFIEAFNFVRRVSDINASNSLNLNLNEILRNIEWLSTESEESIKSSVRFVDNIDKPLWEEVINEIEPPVDSIHVLSRYFDKDPKILNTIKKDLKPKKYIFILKMVRIH